MGVGKERNKPCWCGSGKKLKKCHGTEKARETIVTMDMGKPVAVNGLSFNPQGGLQLYSNGEVVNPVKADLHVSYKRRNKKPKTTFQTALKPKRMSVNQNTWIADFNIIYAIDTNTRIVNDCLISTACAIECEVVGQASSIGLIEKGMLHTTFQVPQRDEAEKHGIVKLIHYAINKFKLNKTSAFKVAVVTDHDLGNIPSYNNLEKPFMIDPEFFLRPQFELVYASADAATDTLWNKFISRCDKTATRILKNATKR